MKATADDRQGQLPCGPPPAAISGVLQTVSAERGLSIRGALPIHPSPTMNLLLIILLLLLLFGGGGFYFGGPAIGGSGLGLVLLIVLVIYLMGGFRGRP